MIVFYLRMALVHARRIPGNEIRRGIDREHPLSTYQHKMESGMSNCLD